MSDLTASRRREHARVAAVVIVLPPCRGTPMKTMQALLATLCCAAALTATPSAHAQNTIKVGVIAEFSGPFADYGAQIEAGMKAYMKQHGDTVAGKKVELI